MSQRTARPFAKLTSRVTFNVSQRARHAWNDAQLAGLEKSLQPVDFLTTYQLSMRGELSQSIDMIEFIQRTSRSKMVQTVGRGVFYDSGLSAFIGIPFPAGWWDDNKSRMADTDFSLVATIDPKDHRCFPQLINNIKTQVDQAKAQWDSWAPWRVFANVSTEAMTNAPERYAEGQVAIDQMRIACALERYHLAHNAYPDSLDVLAPAYLDAVPHDPMSGKPYRYQARADGTFLLYSVGWNQTDDGGTIAFDKNNPKSIDYDNGDWVWPTPKLSH